MASLRTICERAAEAIQQAMTAAVTDPRTVLALSKELRTVLRQAAEIEAPVKDERMAALARKRHGMRAACGSDAATPAAAMREGMRSACEEPCGEACENDAATNAVSDAASRAPVVLSGTYSEIASTTEVIASQSPTEATPSASVQQRAREGDAEALREPVRSACESDAANDAGGDAKPARGKKPNRYEQAEHDPAFLAFWNAYSHKVDKVPACKAWVRISPSPELAAEITRAATAYAAATPDKQFRKHPATWLNNRCWENETATAGNAPASLFARGQWQGVPRNQKPSDYTPANYDDPFGDVNP